MHSKQRSLLSLLDFDECQSGSACRSDLVCNNTFGSYRCECALGFVEDPSSQNPVNTLCNGKQAKSFLEEGQGDQGRNVTWNFVTVYLVVLLSL